MTCDVLNSIADSWFRLGFLSAADQAVTTNWVTVTELYQFGDDAVKFLARVSGVYLTYDNSINIVAPTAAYAMPAGWVFTEGAWLLYSGLPPQLLRETTVGQLFALDADWATTAGNPVRISFDAAGVDYGVLYPAPIANATLAQVMQACPGTIALSASTVAVCPLLQDYFTAALIAGARGKESDFSMPEVAAHLKEHMKLYEATITHLWGSGRTG